MTDITPVNLSYLGQRFSKLELCQVLNLYVATAPPAISKIGTAIEERDGVALTFHAHCLRGSSSTLTVSTIAIVTKQLETAAEQSDWETASELQQKLEAAFLELKEFLSECQILNAISE